MSVAEENDDHTTAMAGVYLEIFSACSKFNVILEKLNDLSPINSKVRDACFRCIC